MCRERRVRRRPLGEEFDREFRALPAQSDSAWSSMPKKEDRLANGSEIAGTDGVHGYDWPAPGAIDELASPNLWTIDARRI